LVRAPASPKKGGREERKIRSWWGPKVPKIAAARARTCQNSPFPRFSHRGFTKTFDQAETRAPLFNLIYVRVYIHEDQHGRN
jgi:hypothetical protein